MGKWLPRWLFIEVPAKSPFPWSIGATESRVEKVGADRAETYRTLLKGPERVLRWDKAVTRFRLERAGLSMPHRREWVGGV